MAKLTWFRMLKASARNCTRIRSLIGMFLINDMSRLATPGAVSMFLPASPKRFGSKVPFGLVGNAKHCVLM